MVLPNRILCFKWLYILSQCAHWVSTESTVLSLAHRDTTENCAIPNAHALMNSVTHRLAAPINMVWPLCLICIMNIIIEVPLMLHRRIFICTPLPHNTIPFATAELQLLWALASHVRIPVANRQWQFHYHVWHRLYQNQN